MSGRKQGRFTRVLAVTPTISASPNYADGDLIGGKMSFTGAARGKSLVANTGTIISVVVTDKAGQAIAMNVVFFDADPASTTFTDNAALTVADADLTKIVGVARVATFEAFADNGVGYVHDIKIPFNLGSGTTLYGAIVTEGAHNAASTSDLTVRVGIQQD